MQTTYNKITSLLAFAVALLATAVLGSCSGSFLEEYSQDLSRVKSAQDLQELETGSCNLPLANFYIKNSMLYAENRNYDILHLMSDELEENYAADEDPDYSNVRDDFFPYFCWQKNTYLNFKGSNTYSNDEEKLFDKMYELIGNCNMVIKAADDVESSKDDERLVVQRVVGETHFLRAFYYLNLVNLYAAPYAPSTAATTPGVPLKTTEYIEDKEYTRSSVAEVYAQIVSDLSDAEQLLSTTGKQSTIYHPDLNCVYLLRSRVALYMQDWATAKKYAELSLEQNNTLQNLIGWTPTNYPISSGNPEVIYSNGASMFGSLIFGRPGKSSWSDHGPFMKISDHLYGLYDKDDSRLSSYITTKDDKISGLPTYHKIDNSIASWGKYKTVSDVFSLRSAEAYLNLAEADAQLGNDAEACKTLTTLRSYRISGAKAVSLTGSDLITFVREERERELCLEGHRWFDLRRYSVDAKYPFTKSITHTYTTYVSVNYYMRPQQTLFYTLQPGDAALTLDFPKNVKNFQNSIGSNERPDRQPSSTTEYDTSDGDDDW